MSDCSPAPNAQQHELGLTRFIEAPPASVWRCWTEPELLMQWFAPAPWRTVAAELDVRAGGSSRIVMRSPEGEDMAPHHGTYLEVLPQRLLVMTDAYTRAWEPSAKPFSTMLISFEPEGGGTRYTARVRHWNEADRQAHAAMGFDAGWGQCTDQLGALARTL